MSEKVLVFKWTVSRGRDTYGYNICTLYSDDRRVARCNGRDYDMKGSCLGDFIASAYPDRLTKLDRPFYGLTFHDPNYKTSPEIVDREERSESLWLESYQASLAASSHVPTGRHTVPLIDGGVCGFSTVKSIGRAIGVNLNRIVERKNESIYLLTD